MEILVINCGSSSLKFQLINAETENVKASGLCERIGIDGRLVYQPAGCDKISTDVAMPDHKEAIKLVIEALTNPENGVVKSLSEIDAVGHRIVHGGEKFATSVIINDEVIKVLEECTDLAPLHNPANITGILAAQELMPGVPMVGVFDTAFHQTMPAKAYTYGVPHEYYDKYAVRRYGFHGTSHAYVSARAAELAGKPYDQCKTIVCHLGNGSSICAVENGKSVDTSMGLTPLEGLLMGTRSGDIDAGALEYIMKKEGIEFKEMMNILNKKSGLLGVSGVSSDSRDVMAAADEGNKNAALAIENFNYRVAKYVGSYAAAMNGVDVIAFTAGIGENAIGTRLDICKYFEYLGIKIDEEKNNVRGKEVEISTPDSKVKVFIIPTNEELKIARETVALVK